MKYRKRLIFLICCMLLLLAVPVQAAGKIKISGGSKPGTLKKGNYFNMKGTITSTNPLKEIRCTIYNSSNKKCLQRYVAYPYSTTYNLKNADPYLAFDVLNSGTYYYKVLCIDTTGYQKRVINKKFKVKGNGKIKIVNPVPSKDISLSTGKSYAIGGKITSTYNIKKITGSTLNSNNKAVYSKTVKPNKKSYDLKNSAIDNAMQFDRLAAGTYKYKVTVTDSQGTSGTVIYRTVTVKGSSGVSPNATGNGNSNNTTYLTTNEVVTAPSGFAPRTTRPGAGSPYYYNKNYNIYYKYDSLAPTGKPISTGSKYYVNGNCTWYACGRAMEIVAAAGGNINKVKEIFGYDPVGIYNLNLSKKNFKTGSTPKIGALAVFSYGADGDAHIAVVENVIDGVPYVSESGYSITNKKPSASNIIFKYQSIYKWAMGRKLLGYIYLI